MVHGDNYVRVEHFNLGAMLIPTAGCGSSFVSGDAWIVVASSGRSQGDR